uniref:Uncharacterized protein n=1 Tax=Solanum tuberosum TaxID=4113 RepID=M1DN30_SOLTU
MRSEKGKSIENPNLQLIEIDDRIGKSFSKDCPVVLSKESGTFTSRSHMTLEGNVSTHVHGVDPDSHNNFIGQKICGNCCGPIKAQTRDSPNFIKGKSVDPILKFPQISQEYTFFSRNSPNNTELESVMRMKIKKIHGSQNSSEEHEEINMQSEGRREKNDLITLSTENAHENRTGENKVSCQ